MSTRYNTGNPIESTDVRDMSDNAKNFDEFVNSASDEFTDRLGIERKTIHGMNSEFDYQILNMGFTRVGTFATGATLTNPRQTLLWDVANGGDGQEYGWSGSFLPSGKLVPPGSAPNTTGGIAVGAWISRFDPELRIAVREALRRTYAEAGFNMVNGSFEVGGTVATSTDVLLYEATGVAYSWGGALPKVVPANSTPANSGGIGAAAWSAKFSALLRTTVEENVISITSRGAVAGDKTKAQSNLRIINDAIMELYNRGGGTLLIPAGNFYVGAINGSSELADKYIIMRSGITLRGVSKSASKLTRCSPNTIFNLDIADNNRDFRFCDMTLDGNPEEWAYAANLVYIEGVKGCLFSNMRFQDIPGLHALDINGCTDVLVSFCDFVGHDQNLSIAFGGSNYRPEAIQIGQAVATLIPSKNVDVSYCTFGPSDNLPSVLVSMGNHDVGTGGGAENVTMFGCESAGNKFYMARPFGWKNTKILYSSLRDSTAIAVSITGRTDAYDNTGKHIPGSMVACDGVEVVGCKFETNNNCITAVAVTSYPTFLRHKNIRINDNECSNLATTNHGIQLSWCEDVEINGGRYKDFGRGIYATYCVNLKINGATIINSSVSSIEVTEAADSFAGLGYTGKLKIDNCYLEGAQYYGINLAAVVDFEVSNNYFTRTSLLEATRHAILCSTSCTGGSIKNNTGGTSSDPNKPVNGVNVTPSCSNVVVAGNTIPCTGAPEVNSATGNSYLIARLISRSSAPTAGTWRGGDRVTNSAPAVGSPKGWICTVAGTPGTWVSEGNL